MLWWYLSLYGMEQFALVGVNNGNTGTFAIAIYIDSATGKAVVQIIGGRGAFNQIKNVDVVGPTAGRRFIFTNNLAISCVLTGDDPFNATVSAFWYEYCKQRFNRWIF